MTMRAQYDRKRRNAKREAGWREVAFHVPEYVKSRLGQIASTYLLSRERVMSYALQHGIELIDRREWSRLAKAEPIRIRRRDAGVCRVCRARLAERRRTGEAVTGEPPPFER